METRRCDYVEGYDDALQSAGGTKPVENLTVRWGVSKAEHFQKQCDRRRNTFCCTIIAGSSSLDDLNASLKAIFQ